MLKSCCPCPSVHGHLGLRARANGKCVKLSKNKGEIGEFDEKFDEFDDFTRILSRKWLNL